MVKRRKEPTLSSVLGSQEDLVENKTQAKQRASRQGYSSQSAYGTTRGYTAPRTQSSSGFLWLTFIITLVALAGAGYVLWQLQATQAVIDSQRLRIVELERQLTTSGDSASQSLASVSAKVHRLDERAATAMSEIDKLWAARNVQKKGIASLGKQITEQKEQLAAQKKQVLEQKKQVTAQKKQLAGIDKKLLGFEKTQDKQLKLEESVASIVTSTQKLSPLLESTAQTATEQELLIQSLRERVASQEKSLQRLTQKSGQNSTAATTVKSMEQRLKNTEEAITAFDAFRRTVNRDLLQLKQSGSKKR